VQRISGFVAAHVGGSDRSDYSSAVTALSGGNAAVGRCPRTLALAGGRWCGPGGLGPD
jgi:hypothetical protein